MVLEDPEGVSKNSRRGLPPSLYTRIKKREQRGKEAVRTVRDSGVDKKKERLELYRAASEPKYRVVKLRCVMVFELFIVCCVRVRVIPSIVVCVGGCSEELLGFLQPVFDTKKRCYR